MQIVLIFSIILIPVAFLEGCTGLKLRAKDGQTVHGRTLEFGVDVKTSIAYIPREYAFTSETSNGRGLSYKSKYASIGAYCFNILRLMDGINEKGLAVGTFYFPGFAGYKDTTLENQNRSLSPIDFPNWILTQFANLEEVKKEINNVAISPTVFKDWGENVPPFHYIIYDKNGNSLVIEPIDGKFKIYDNPLGVLTNSPNFDWHMTNLRNFINLTPNNAPPLTVAGMTFAPFGQGSGMVGLPGDFTPPSRFVRAALFSITATPSTSAHEAIFQVFHLLNQFDIPVGIARQKENGIIHTDYTLATVARDPNHLKYFYRTYNDQTIRMIDLNTFNKEGKEILVIGTDETQSFVDMSNQLKPIKNR